MADRVLEQFLQAEQAKNATQGRPVKVMKNQLAALKLFVEERVAEGGYAVTGSGCRGRCHTVYRRSGISGQAGA